MKVPDLSKAGKTMTTQDKLNLIQIAIILPVVLLSIPTCFTRKQQFTEDYFPNPLTLLWTLVPFTIIMILRKVLAEGVFLRLGDKFLVHKACWSEKTREFRVKRFGLCLFKAIYFFISTPMGFMLFRNEDWMPKQLYGKGKQDLKYLWEGYPYQEHNSMIDFYYIFGLGYHFHSLVCHMMTEKRGDYFENLLHHLATVFLMVFSFCNNCTRIGVLVLIVHDIVDFVMYVAKSLNDLKYQTPVYIAFGFLVYTFFKFRLYIFGRYIIYEGALMGQYYLPFEVPGMFINYWLMVGLLCVLWCLHVYWFYLIVMMVAEMLTSKGHIQDPHAEGR